MNQDAAQDTSAFDPRDDAVPRLGPQQRAAFILFEAVLIPAAMGIGWVVDARPLATFTWDLEAALWGTTVAALLVTGVILATRFPAAPWRGRPTNPSR